MYKQKKLLTMLEAFCTQGGSITTAKIHFITSYYSKAKIQYSLEYCNIIDIIIKIVFCNYYH